MTTSRTSHASLSGKPLLRLQSPADVAEVVPYLVGFHPRESAVLLSLRGRRRRLGLLLRADLPPDGEEAAFATYAGSRLSADNAQETVLVVYPASGVPPGPEAHRPLVTAVLAELGQRGITLAGALCVGEGRWWSYFCAAHPSCPPEGEPFPGEGEGAGASVVSATAAFAGLTALPDRQALADTLRPPGFLAAAAMEQEFARVSQQLTVSAEAGQPAEGGPRPSLLADESLALLQAALAESAGGRQELTNEQVARLVLGLLDRAVRDEVLTWSEGPQGDAALSLWQLLARRSVAPYDVVPLTLVAWAAWCRGDGALAGIAVERARQRDPGYVLAELIEQAVDAGVHPRVLRQLTLMRHRSRQRSGS
jgi:hypothetical protein